MTPRLLLTLRNIYTTELCFDWPKKIESLGFMFDVAEHDYSDNGPIDELRLASSCFDVEVSSALRCMGFTCQWHETDFAVPVNMENGIVSLSNEFRNLYFQILIFLSS